MLNEYGPGISCLCFMAIFSRLFFFSDCGPISKPSHGTVKNNSTLYTAEAKFTCDTGYEFTDTNNSLVSVTCLENGTWSGNPPACQLKPKGTEIVFTFVLSTLSDIFIKNL